MAEYIERSAVLQNKTTMTEYDEGGWDAPVSVVRVEDIEAIPAADVAPVVRCKDCKHGAIAGVGYRWCIAWERFQTMGDEGFCCFGERRADNG